jgi:hypothetical protein
MWFSWFSEIREPLRESVRLTAEGRRISPSLLAAMPTTPWQVIPQDLELILLAQLVLDERHRLAPRSLS